MDCFRQKHKVQFDGCALKHNLHFFFHLTSFKARKQCLFARLWEVQQRARWLLAIRKNARPADCPGGRHQPMEGPRKAPSHVTWLAGPFPRFSPSLSLSTRAPRSSLGDRAGTRPRRKVSRPPSSDGSSDGERTKSYYEPRSSERRRFRGF